MLIVKLGGSVIQDSLTEINPKVFDCIKKLIALNEQIIIATGGGKICRLFQNTLSSRGFTNTDNLHWVGTRAMNLQSEFVRSLFPVEETFPLLIDSNKLLSEAVNKKDSYKYFCTGGWDIGHSSDFDAANMAVHFRCKNVLRISNVDYVYDSDPDFNPEAKEINNISWKDYIELIGNPENFDPGKSYPVDPVAAEVGLKNNLIFYFTSLERFLEVEKFDLDNFAGTVIGS